MINKLLRFLIARERKRQVKLGYTAEYDFDMEQTSPGRLTGWAVIYFERGKYFEALALLQANEDVNDKIMNQ